MSVMWIDDEKTAFATWATMWHETYGLDNYELRFGKIVRMPR